MPKLPIQDSPEWKKIVDDAYENLSECPQCEKSSIVKLPASIEVHSDGFTTLHDAETYCCDPECDLFSNGTPYHKLRGYDSKEDSL